MVKSLSLIPHQQVGPLKFGDARSMCRRLLEGSPITTFGQVDDYYELGIHLHFDSAEFLEFIEYVPPATVVLGNIPPVDAAGFYDAIPKAEDRIVIDSATSIYPKIGVAIYAPYWMNGRRLSP